MSDPDKVAQDKSITVTDPHPDSPGQYMFANLEELDGVIAKWHAEGYTIQADGQSLTMEQMGAGLGLLDVITHEYMSTLGGVFDALVQHNDKMYEYNAGYAKRLAECREAMAKTEISSTGEYIRANRGQ